VKARVYYRPLFILGLSFFSCLVAFTACFFPDWFEYSADWVPCKSTSRESSCPAYTQERLPLFGVGPERFFQQVVGVNGTGCYVEGRCAPREVLHRLYQANLTETQRVTIYSMRLIGILGVAASICCLVLAGLKNRSILRSWYNQKTAAFILGCMSLLLAGVLLLVACVVRFIVPSSAALLGGEEYPVDCQTAPPQTIECGYPRTTSDGERYVAYETLGSGTSNWEFERVLFQGPAWTAFSFVLVAIVWLRGRLWRRQELSTEQS
jgi:hypothetical protein